MKKEEMLLALNMIDDKYIEEAAPKKRHPKFRIAIIAAAILLLALALFLFFPYNTRPPSVKEYSDSDYYEIIQKINDYTYEKPEYANNFDLFLSSFILSKNETPPDSSNNIESPSPSVNFYDPENYSEDNSANTLKEGDIYAVNDSHIFISEKIYSINGEDSKIVQHYNFRGPSGRKVFMSTDGNTLICVFSSLVPDSETGKKQRFTEIVAYDVRDPKNIKQKSCVSISGSLLNCIYNNGRLIVVSSYSPSKKNIDYRDPLTFVPHISRNYGEFSAIPATALIAPETLTSLRYTEFLMLDENDLTVIDCRAHISESSDIYISSDSIYTTRTVTSEQKSGENIIITPQTILSRIAYSSSGFTDIGTVTLDGQVLSHNFLNEQSGTLYAVTKTALIERHNKLPIYACCACMHRETLISQNAEIYAIDAESMEIKKHASGICGKNLELSSVTYSREDAHLTFLNSDAKTEELVSVKLSDFNAVVSKQEEERTSMLLEIGNSLFVAVSEIKATKSTPSATKVSIFRADSDGLEKVASYNIIGAGTSVTYQTEKRVFIDRERGLIGFGINRKQYEGEEPDRYDADGMPEFNKERYVLLQYKDGELKLIADVPLSGSSTDKRAIYRDGYLYAFSMKGITALPVDVE